jgi:hypothetical protein
MPLCEQVKIPQRVPLPDPKAVPPAALLMSRHAVLSYSSSLQQHPPATRASHPVEAPFNPNSHSEAEASLMFSRQASPQQPPQQQHHHHHHHKETLSPLSPSSPLRAHPVDSTQLHMPPQSPSAPPFIEPRSPASRVADAGHSAHTASEFPLSPDDGLVERQFHELLSFLIGWLHRERPSMLRSYDVCSYNATLDQEFLLTNVEIYLCEVLKLRSIEAFEDWLASWSSNRFQNHLTYSIDDKPAKLLCLLKYFHASSHLGQQIRLFRSQCYAEKSSRPAAVTNAPSSISSIRRHRCTKCEVSLVINAVFVISSTIFRRCMLQESFEYLDDMQTHFLLTHEEDHNRDDNFEVPASFTQCPSFGPLPGELTAHQPAKVAETLAVFRQKHDPLPAMNRPQPGFESVDVFGKWRGIEGHNNSCYFDVLAMAMFAFHDRFDELFSHENLKRAHPDDAILLRLLADLVVRPLRLRMFVPRTAFATMRLHLSDVTKEADYAGCGLMDPSELLMHFDEHLPGGLKCISSYQSDTKLYSDIVVAPVNIGGHDDLTAQKLLSLHCKNTGLIFDQAPKAFFLQMRPDMGSAQW